MQNVLPSAVSGEQPVLPVAPVPSAADEMRALDRHARVGMICYTGRFGGGDLAAIRKDMAIALNVAEPGRK